MKGLKNCWEKQAKIQFIRKEWLPNSRYRESWRRDW